MRQEEIVYPPDIPVEMVLMQVENYPLHWQNSIEIVLVLEGSIDIEIGTDFYGVEKGEVEIVNPGEVHSIRSTSRDNLILSLHIDPDFFEEYYQGAKDVFFYADSSQRKIQESPRYQKLRRYVAILYYELLSQYENYQEEIQTELLDLMYFLLNNFHYLFYEEESLRDDDMELERYHRIVRHISKNYMEKVSLQDIADQEFLTSQYLSYKIKNTFGYGFNDFLNLTRVEESIKLLVNSDMNISEISQAVGFSHVRYYNRHFNIHYGMTPMEYRKKFQMTDEELEQVTRYTVHPLEEALPYLTAYLETYERYEYDDRIQRYEVDAQGEGVGEFSYSRVINLGSGKDLYTYRHDPHLVDKIRGLGFEYGLVEDLNGSFALADKVEQTNWHFIDSLIDDIYQLGLKPIFLTDGYQEVVDLLIEYLENHRKDLPREDIEFVSREEFYHRWVPLYRGPHQYNDTLSRVGHVIQQNLSHAPQLPRLIDSYQTTITQSDTFFGGEGLMTFNGLLKPSYYTYKFLSFMGEELLDSQPGMVVTRSAEGFQVLLYDPVEEGQKQAHIGQRRRYSVNISNLSQAHRVVRYELNKDSGSVYEKWSYLGKPAILTQSDVDILEKAAIPEIKFYHAPPSMVYNIFTTVKDKGATLYLFQKE